MPHVVDDYSDDRNKAWCIHCGSWLSASPNTRDHTPSKILLDRPFPDNLAVTPICATCNHGFSLDEEYVAAFLSVVLSGSTCPSEQVIPRIGRALRRNDRLRQLLESQKVEQRDLFEPADVRWIPDRARFERVLLKNARAHLFFENGEPMRDDPQTVRFMPLALMTDRQFAEFFEQETLQPWCEVGSRWNTRVMCGDSFDAEGFLVVQPGVYRFRVEAGGAGIRTVIREYLATTIYW